MIMPDKIRVSGKLYSVATPDMFSGISEQFKPEMVELDGNVYRSNDFIVTDVMTIKKKENPEVVASSDDIYRLSTCKDMIQLMDILPVVVDDGAKSLIPVSGKDIYRAKHNPNATALATGLQTAIEKKMIDPKAYKDMFDQGQYANYMRATERDDVTMKTAIKVSKPFGLGIKTVFYDDPESNDPNKMNAEIIIDHIKNEVQVIEHGKPANYAMLYGSSEDEQGEEECPDGSDE